MSCSSSVLPQNWTLMTHRENWYWNYVKYLFPLFIFSKRNRDQKWTSPDLSSFHSAPSQIPSAHQLSSLPLLERDRRTATAMTHSWNVWDLGKQIANWQSNKKAKKTLFVYLSKRIWCTTGYEFRALPIEKKSYAYEVIANYRVWLTIQQLWNHCTSSFTKHKPWTQIFAEKGAPPTTWNYYSDSERCWSEGRRCLFSFPKSPHVRNVSHWIIYLLVCVMQFHVKLIEASGSVTSTLGSLSVAGHLVYEFIFSLTSHRPSKG